MYILSDSVPKSHRTLCLLRKGQLVGHVKVKQSHNRPGVAQRVAGGLGSQIFVIRAHEGGEVVSLTHRPPLTPGNVPGTRFHLGLSRPQGHGTVGRKCVTEESSDTTGDRSRDHPTSSAAP